MKLSDKINKSHLGKKFKITHKSGYEFIGTVLFNSENQLMLANKWGEDGLKGYSITSLQDWIKIKEV